MRGRWVLRGDIDFRATGTHYHSLSLSLFSTLNSSFLPFLVQSPEPSLCDQLTTTRRVFWGIISSRTNQATQRYCDLQLILLQFDHYSIFFILVVRPIR